MTITLVHDMPDGSTTVYAWHVDEDTAGQVAAMLGEADAVHLLTAEQSARAEIIADGALALYR